MAVHSTNWLATEREPEFWTRFLGHNLWGFIWGTMTDLGRSIGFQWFSPLNIQNHWKSWVSVVHPLSAAGDASHLGMLVTPRGPPAQESSPCPCPWDLGPGLHRISPKCVSFCPYGPYELLWQSSTFHKKSKIWVHPIIFQSYSNI